MKNYKKPGLRPGVPLAIVLLCVWLTLSPGASAHSGASGVVKQRMDRMLVMGKSMKALGEMVKGNAPLEAALVIAHAGKIQTVTDDLTEQFPAGSINGPSEALPAIWEQWARFVQLSDELGQQAGLLARVASAGSPDVIKAQYLRLAETCRTCHADYRKKKSKQEGTPIVVTDISMQKHVMAGMTHGEEDMPAAASDMDMVMGKEMDMDMVMDKGMDMDRVMAESPAASAPAVVTEPVVEAQSERQSTPVSRGEYLFRLGGCASCHTADPEAPLAGGLTMETPFGTFYTPNISPDKATGIGNWSEQAFIRAIKAGVSPSGDHYYPAFPYTSYSKMSDRELLDLKAYLDSQPPVRRENREHDLEFPFNQRWLLAFWKSFFFDASEFQASAARSAAWNRGAYIVSGPGHCAECHSPRNLFGALDEASLLTGNPKGPEDEEIPSIHGSKSPRFATWNKKDIQFALETGVTPDGDAMGGSMAHVIKNTTSHLTPEDLEAIAEYLSQPL